MAFFSIDKISGGTTLDVDASSTIQINSSAGAISIGNDADAQAINIGTGGAARTITVGNTTGATALDVNLGTGGLTVDCEDGGAISLDANGAPSNFTLTSTADADDFTIALAGATDSSLILSSTGTGADALQVTASAGGMDITAANTMDITTSANNANITIDPHGSGTLALGSADNTAVNIGALAITATSVNALTLTDGTASFALGGTGATSISAATTLDLDCTGNFTINSSGGTIDIGNDAVAQNMSIGAGAAARTITIGNVSGATALNLSTGTGGLTITTDTATFTSENSTDPLVVIKNTTDDANGARLQFVKDKGSAGADGDDIGVIEFVGDDAGQTQTTFSKIVAEVSEADNTDEAGKLSLFVAVSDGTTSTLTTGLILEGEHDTGSEVDVTIANGAASTTTISGNLSVTTLSAAVSDTDKFIVSDSGVLKYRTGTQVVSDIGAVSTATNNAFTGTNTFYSMLYTVQEATSTATSDGSTSLTISKSVVLLSHVGSASTQTYTIGDGTDGQLIHFFFATEASDQIIKLDFGATTLASGSGLARYLTFNVTGQSATIIFTAARTLNSVTIAKSWRVINTGAAVS